MSDSECFSFVPVLRMVKNAGRFAYVKNVPSLSVTAMLLASRTVLQQHREITAVVVTYSVFLSAILVLAWAIA